MIKIFIFDVPVIGDAKIYEFEEASYKWWTLWGQNKEDSLTLRETVGKVSLQERVDAFLANDSRYMSSRTALSQPLCITPAPEKLIKAWQDAHPEEMKSYIGEGIA